MKNHYLSGQPIPKTNLWLSKEAFALYLTVLGVAAYIIKVIIKTNADKEKKRYAYELKVRQEREIYAIKHPPDPQAPKTEVLPEGIVKKPWQEMFDARHWLPLWCPPLLGEIMAITPEGLSFGMLCHMLSMLGAFCFSRVRARYLDGMMKAPNVLVLIEGESGIGKNLYNHVYEFCFRRMLKRDIAKYDDNGLKDPIIQAIGPGDSNAVFSDTILCNKEVHSFFFTSEVAMLDAEMRRNNCFGDKVICKAFDNDSITRRRKGNISKSGCTKVFMNMSLTGTPVDVANFVKGRVEGGMVSRFCNCLATASPDDAGGLPFPDDEYFDHFRDQMDEWAAKYCYHQDEEGNCIPADITIIDLDYVNKVLDVWTREQRQEGQRTNNPAQVNNARRMANIAFNCAIVAHMLCVESGEPSEEWVSDIALLIAKYNMGRFLLKYGQTYNESTMQQRELEYVYTGGTYGENPICTITGGDPITPEIEMEWYNKYVKGEYGYQKIANDYTLRLKRKIKKDQVRNAIVRIKKVVEQREAAAS